VTCNATTPGAPGDKTWYFYDKRGLNTFTVRGIASGGVANAKGEVLETRFDAFGQVVETLAYSARVSIGGSQLRGNVQSALNALTYNAASDTRRQFSYDVRGLLSKSIDATGATSTFSYTAFGQLYRENRFVDTTAAAMVQHDYDSRGLETKRTDFNALGTVELRSVSRTYDAFGRVVSSTDANNIQTTFTYDRIGRQLSQSHAGGLGSETISTAYDAFSRVVSQTNANLKTTTFEYSDLARTFKVVSPEGVTVTTTHDRFGQTVKLVKGPEMSTFVYNRDGDLVSKQEAGWYDTTYVYDALRHLVSTTDGTGCAVAYSYDAVGRVLTRTQDPGGAGHPPLTTTYTYDAQGRQLTVTDATSKVTAMSYDTEGRLVKVVKDPAGLKLETTYAYDSRWPPDHGHRSSHHRRRAQDRIHLRRARPPYRRNPAGRLHADVHVRQERQPRFVNRRNAAVTRYAYDQDNQLRFSVDALAT
jgi:YD repeat-containing protein